MATGSDEESPLPTPALEFPYATESATMSKGYGYSAPIDIKVGHDDNDDIVEPYETAF